MGRMQRQTKFKIADGVGIDYDDNEAVPDLEDFQRYLDQDYWTINKAACYLLGYSDDALEDTDHERSEQIEALQQYLQSQLDKNGKIRLNTRSYTYFGHGKTPLPKEEFLEWAESHKELFEPRPPVILQIKKDLAEQKRNSDFQDDIEFLKSFKVPIEETVKLISWCLAARCCQLDASNSRFFEKYLDGKEIPNSNKTKKEKEAIEEALKEQFEINPHEAVRFIKKMGRVLNQLPNAKKTFYPAPLSSEEVRNYVESQLKSEESNDDETYDIDDDLDIGELN